MACWCGLTEQREPMTASRFRDLFSWDRLSRDPITFTEADDAWLTDTL
jgi:hypothetical protein